MTGKKIDLNFRDMPKELKDDFRKWCKANNITMKWAVSELMQMAIRMNLDIKKPVRKKRK